MIEHHDRRGQFYFVEGPIEYHSEGGPNRDMFRVEMWGPPTMYSFAEIYDTFEFAKARGERWNKTCLQPV